MPIRINGDIRSDDEVTETLIHELVHIFASSNTNYWQILREKYTDENTLIQDHIIIFAILEDVYDKFFGKKPDSFGDNTLSQDYKRAIDIVKEVGYKMLQ